MAAVRKLIAGNWKMNGMRAAAASFAEAVIAGAAEARADLLVCPPTTLLADLAQRFAASPVAVGGQDCHVEPKGAHTGDVAAVQLQDAGADYVIVGHSERRADHGEDDATVKAKATAALSIGLIPIICVGETAVERAEGRALDVVEAQLLGSWPDGAAAETVVVAYEPVWAIGSGAVPTLAEIAEVHGRLRALTDQRGAPGVRLLYGGSVKPSNAGEILAVANVDGALVGGASLLAVDFLGIAAAA